MQTTTVQLNKNITIDDMQRLLTTKIDKGYTPQPITPYLYNNGVIVKGDRNGFRFKIDIMPDQPKGLDLLILDKGYYIIIDNTSQLYRLCTPKGKVISSRVNNDYSPFKGIDKVFNFNSLDNPIKENLSLAYKGYNFNASKLKDWLTVYNTLKRSTDHNQQSVLDKINENIEKGIKSKNIKLMEATQLTKVVKTGQLNSESYELERDYSSPIIVGDCKAMLKHTIYKSAKSDKRIGVYALSWSASLITGFSPYFGIIINDQFKIY